MIKRYVTIEKLEKILISNKDRFKVDTFQRKILKNKFKSKNILVLGAAGSIGKKFTIKLIDFNFKKLYLIDKDENELTELNRLINIKNKSKKIDYICADIINFPFKSFLREKKINLILNFAAIKHVRSEENNYSLNYMFKTNSLSFLNFKYSKNVESIFSISTDKVYKPTSMLGISKKLMEYVLTKIKEKNPKIDISSVRFTNVSFSNGSILKNIYDKILSNKIVGVPKNIQRYFITHEEAVSLCLKSFLNETRNVIIQPSDSYVNRAFDLKKLSLKIFSAMGVKVKLKGKNKNIVFQKKISQGQKLVEDLNEDSENYDYIKSDKSIKRVNFFRLKNLNQILEKINNCKNKNNYINLARKIYPKFHFLDNKTKVSKII